MEINVQSYIDVITNSSTSVYQVAGCNSVSMVEDLIDTILKMGGSGMRCKDVFKIKTVCENEDRYREWALDALYEYDEEEWNDSENYKKYLELGGKLNSVNNNPYGSRDWDKQRELEDSIIELGQEDGVLMDEESWVEETNEEECYNGGHPIETRIIIEPINYIPSPRQTEILQSINNLFDCYASYD